MGRCIGVGTAGRYYGKGKLASQGKWVAGTPPTQQYDLVHNGNIVVRSGNVVVYRGAILPFIDYPITHNGQELTHNGIPLYIRIYS